MIRYFFDLIARVQRSGFDSSDQFVSGGDHHHILRKPSISHIIRKSGGINESKKKGSGCHELLNFVDLGHRHDFIPTRCETNLMGDN